MATRLPEPTDPTQFGMVTGFPPSRHTPFPSAVQTEIRPMFRPIFRRILPLGLIGIALGASASSATAPVQDDAVAPEALPSTPEADDPALAAMAEFIASAGIDREAEGWKTRLPKPPLLTFDPGREYFWHLRTSQGDITLELLTDVAPMHVSMVLYLSAVGFYDGLGFHRVISRFMAQGGCPLGTGSGGPGFKIAGEVNASATHDQAGVLSAANTGRGTPEGSQFFLTFVPTPHLDGIHTVYGRVIDGMDTVKKLEAQGSASGTPRIPLTIEHTTITVAGDPLTALPSAHDSDDAAIKGLRDFIQGQEEAGKIDESQADWKTLLPKPPVQTFTPGRTYYWNLLTNKGVIKLKLMPEVAPMHVTTTVYLSLLGFYDGLKFHRVIPGFMAQGGCPLGTGSGNPGFRMNRELDPNVKHSKMGILSAANSGGDDTDGSQFFLTFRATPHLDGGYTVYGEVVEGLDVVSELEKFGSPSGRTKEPLEILRATITIE